MMIAIVSQTTPPCPTARRPLASFALQRIFPIRCPLLTFQDMACTEPPSCGKGSCFPPAANPDQVTQDDSTADDSTAFSLVDGLFPGRADQPAQARHRTEGSAPPGGSLRAAEESGARNDLRESLHPDPGVLRSRHDPAGRPGHLPVPTGHSARSWRAG